jgi:hypothetical protein
MEQNPADLTKFKDQAVDLDKAMKEREQAKAKAEADAMRAAQEKVVVWNKAMRKAFKGIFPSSSRRIFMEAEMARQDRAREAA